MKTTRLLLTTLLGLAATVVASERDAHADSQRGVGWCQARPSSGSTSIVAAPDLALKLDFQADGNLALVATDGRGTQWSSNTAGIGQTVCLQADGNLVVSSAAGAAVFATNTGGLGVGTLGLDACGVSLSGGGAEYWRAGSSMCLCRPAAGDMIAMFVQATSLYVSAENAGASALVANRTEARGWEAFEVVDLGGGNVAFKSPINGKYVTAENAGASPLVANRTAIGPWETFQWLDLGNGDFALRATVNGKYVTAEDAGASALIANRTAIGPWERFHWLSVAEPVAAEPPPDASPGIPPSGDGMSFLWSQGWGNTTFGAGVWVRAAALSGADPSVSHLVTPDFRMVMGNAGIAASVFSHPVTVLDMSGAVGNLYGASSDLSIIVMGTTIRSGTLSASASWSVDKTFFDESQTFQLGPVPVTVHADLTGTLGVSSTFTPGTTLSAAVTPSADLSVNASVSVGIAVASAGVEGSLSLINVGVPFQLDYDVAHQAYSATSDLTVTTLQGNIDLFAEAEIDIGFASISGKYTKNIASWGGVSYTQNLLSRSGTL